MLNDLTKRLYAEGCTRERHPDTVYWSDFENFGYKFEYIVKTTWETGCGLLVEGRRISTSDVSYDGVWYCAENNNPVIRCPYGKKDCPKQPALLNRWNMCICHQTERPYEYEQSAEKIVKDAEQKAHEQYIQITGGQYCACVVGANGHEGGYYQFSYDPDSCIRYGCTNPVCCVTKRERDLSKVNIYYDIVRVWRTRQGIIEDERTSVEKGVKVFQKPVARTDAEAWLQRKKAEYNPFLPYSSIIQPKLSHEDRRMEYFSKHHRAWPDYDYFEFQYHVENIRIARSEQRDLLQDLRDVESGIEVFHASDMEKAKVQAKRDARGKREGEKMKKSHRAALKAFDEHWDDPKWQRTLKVKFGSDFDTMIREKQEIEAGVGQNYSLFE